MMVDWPQLSAGDQPTMAVLHLASQMIGKLRVRHAPWSNHGWHVALQPTAKGLRSPPTDSGDGRSFTLALDLCSHDVRLEVSDSTSAAVPLRGATIADLHRGLVAMLDAAGLPSDFHGLPSEIPDAVRFADDDAPRSYNPETAERFRDAMNLMLPVFERFRAGFAGKASPVHFWWGSFDLAVTRFSGRPAPLHPGGVPGLPDRITREAYSHEVSSAGFWAGGVTPAEPLFYSYAYPEPTGFRGRDLSAGGWDDNLSEYVLAYETVRSVDDPAAVLATFLEETYEIAADQAGWARAALERKPVAP